MRNNSDRPYIFDYPKFGSQQTKPSAIDPYNYNYGNQSNNSQITR